MAAAPTPWRPLGRLLVDQGLLSEGELERALAQQASTGKRLGETIVELGFVSHPALSRALAEQYGIELKAESGFGTGLRAKIEGHHERRRESAVEPRLRLVGGPSVAEEPPQSVRPAGDAAEGDALHLAQLEEHWARLAAAEELLAEARLELVALRRAAARRRDQGRRLLLLIRRRERRLVEQSNRPAERVNPSLGHVVFAPLGGGYELVDRDGAPPEPGAIVRLAHDGAPVLVGRIGRSPLPGDPRPCVYAEPLGPSPD